MSLFVVTSDILQEVIKSPKDARATEVKFFLDCHQLQTLPYGLVTDTEKYVELSRFYGPALMSFNNALSRKKTEIVYKVNTRVVKLRIHSK